MRRLFSVILFASALLAQTSNYPSALDTNTSLFVTADNIQTSLSTAMGSSDTYVTVTSPTGFAANMVATICDSVLSSSGLCTQWEHLLITSVSGNQIYVTRGVGGSTAHSHSVGALISVLIDAVHQQALKSAVMAVETALGPSLSNVMADLTWANLQNKPPLVYAFDNRSGYVYPATGDYTAAMVTNAVDQTGGYYNPSWITALDWTKIINIPTLGGVVSLNGLTGTLSISGQTNGITVSPSGTTVTLALPQALNSTSNPTFGNLTVTSCTGCTTGSSGISSLNTLTGALVIAGTAHEIAVAPSGTTITLSTPQPLDTTSNPTFSNLTVTSCTGCTTGSAGVSSLNTLTGALSIVGTTNEITVTPSGSNITLSTPQAIGTTSNPTFGNLTVTSCTGCTTGSAGVSSLNAQTNAVTIAGQTNGITVSATGGTVTLALPQALNSTANPTFGNLTVTSCTGCGGGSSGVSSLNTLTGALTLAGTSNEIILTPSGGNTVTFSTPQRIDTAAGPTFNGVSATTGFLPVTNMGGNLGSASLYFNNSYLNELWVGNIQVEGGSGNISLNATIVPGTTNTYALGSSSYQFSDVYTQLVNTNQLQNAGSGSISVGTTLLPSSSSTYNLGGVGNFWQTTFTNAVETASVVATGSTDVQGHAIVALSGDFNPSATGTYFLGVSGDVWAGIYGAQIYTNQINFNDGTTQESAACCTSQTSPNYFANTVYHNTGNKSRIVTVCGYNTVANSILWADTDPSSSPTTTVGYVMHPNTGSSGGAACVTFAVLPNNYYKVWNGAGTETIQTWTEWQ